MAAALLLPTACTGIIDGEIGGSSPRSTPESGLNPTMGGAAGSAPVPTETPVGASPTAAEASTPTLTRLSVLQWANTVRQLFQPLDVGDVENALTKDSVVRFDNEADSLFVGQSLHDTLRSEAERLAALVVSDNAALARLVPADTGLNTEATATAYLEQFGRQAFRRPLTAEELQDYLTLFEQGPMLTTGLSAVQAGVRVTLEAFLQSPNFVYRTGFGQAAVGGRARLTHHEIAANLAYALTNYPPDSSLAALADTGALGDATSIASEAARLLPTSAGQLAIDRFYFQYFGLGQYDTLQKDAVEFTEATGPLLHEESRRLLSYLFAQNLGLAEIFTTSVGFVNAPLAKLYGLSGVFDDSAWAQVTFDSSQRPGLLTRLGFVSYFAYQERKNTIKRGAIINSRILCTVLSPPPGLQIPELPAVAAGQTNREVVASVTEGCGAHCHTPLINPAGYAFENFDGLGRFQTTENGKPIDASGSYAFQSGAKAFANVVEFNDALAHSAQAHACYAEKWAANLYARLPRQGDEELVARLAQKSVSEHLSSRDLVLALVSDDAFATRVEAKP